MVFRRFIVVGKGEGLLGGWSRGAELVMHSW